MIYVVLAMFGIWVALASSNTTPPANKSVYHHHAWRDKDGAWRPGQTYGEEKQ